MTIQLTFRQLAELNKATFKAFIESGNYALTYTDACKQFGRTNIDLLLSNKLLHDTSELIGRKRYLISDIASAFLILKNKQL